MKTLSAATVLLVACGGGGKQTPVPVNAQPPATPAPARTQAQEPAKPDEKPQPPRKVMKSMTPTELTWTPLVPEAGDKGPMTAALWGDMASEPNGFMIKLPAGDKGALHTHTNDYHAVSVTGSSLAQDGGKLHPLAPGTYWFQPGGAAHLDACPGKTPCIDFVHYNAGKFDFVPATPARGAQPDPKAIEKPLKAAKWTPLDAKNEKAGSWSVLWGDPQTGESGMYMKIPAGNAPFWHIHKHDYHAVVLAGTLNNIESGHEAKDLPVGSYYYQPGGNKHTSNCKAGGPDCVVYVYWTGAYDTKLAE